MWSVAITRVLEPLVSLFYPPHCVLCGQASGPGQHLCSSCLKSARRIERPFCETCSEPFFGAVTGKFACPNCEGRRFHFSYAVAAYRSRGAVREFVHRFKYDGAFYLRHQLAEWLGETLADDRILAQPVDALVPVPLHPARQREREFNQADVLASIVGHEAELPVSRALRRIRHTTTQTRLDRHERMENLRHAFTVHKDAPVRGKHLVLVDDVLTTGSTLDECARILCKAGAASVRAITVARG
jgi:competence protein ComFC